MALLCGSVVASVVFVLGIGDPSFTASGARLSTEDTALPATLAAEGEKEC